MESKERLFYFSSNRLTGTDDICIISLLDEPGVREISIVCDKGVGMMIEMFVSKPEVLKTSLTNVLADIITRQTDFDMEIDIEDLDDGVYITYIVNKTTGSRIRVKASEAVYLSIISDVPIYIDKDLMQSQSVRHKNLSTSSMSLPVNAVSLEMLQTALENAINDENYELASRLRDEILNRKTKPLNPDIDERG
jgi:uncharacterized protein